MAKAKTRTADLKKQMEALQAQLREAQIAEEHQVGKIARKVGLLDLDLSDDELASVLKHAVERFRDAPEPAPSRPPQEHHEHHG